MNPDCPCKRVKCERHGDCEACKAHHDPSVNKVLPACERPDRKTARKRERAKR